MTNLLKKMCFLFVFFAIAICALTILFNSNSVYAQELKTTNFIEIGSKDDVCFKEEKTYNTSTNCFDIPIIVNSKSNVLSFEYEEFNNIIPIPQLVFDAFNGQYLKVAIGKGITTLQEIQALLNRYSEFFE